MTRKVLTSLMPPPRQLTERACNDPQRMRARKIEAAILAKMPPKPWLSFTAVSRLIEAADDRRTRARLDRLVRDGKMERRREQGIHGPVYLFRIFRTKSHLPTHEAKRAVHRRGPAHPDLVNKS